MITLDGVTYAHTASGEEPPALEDISLSVRAGEDLVILGAGGAGKTTLGLLLAGILAPQAGEIRRAGELAAPPPARLPVGLVLENPEDTFTAALVREELAIVPENLGRSAEEVDRRVAALLAEVGLAGHAHYPPSLLSGGQKQLLAVASVLAGDPVLLVLDEHLSLLDSEGRLEVERLLAGDRGRGRVHLSSDVADSARGTRVAVLLKGRIAWEGPPGDLPLDAETLESWGLVPPDLTRLAELLARRGLPLAPGLFGPEELVERLWPSV